VGFALSTIEDRDRRNGVWSASNPAWIKNTKLFVKLGSL